MRLSRLDLVKYGKFSDRVITLPHATHDFHLIVGPNEAGKSTLRNAILDLFYGIGKISPYGFLHAYADMKLGACIEHDGATLDFFRTKGNKKTLRSNTDEALADDALAPFLGATDRAFFDQMFGLDHDKLVRGGNEILNASNDIGQILFQSATGIGSLGDVRKTLEAEANKLWGPRRSADREYSIAQDELDKAETLLKQVTVRTKEWVEHTTTVERLDAALRSARTDHQALEKDRMRLERIRRIASALTSWRQDQAALQALGAVTSLPENATDIVANAEHELAMASHAHQLFDSQARALHADLEALTIDRTLLLRAADIQSLSDMRQQVRHHQADIIKRQHEVDLQWHNAQSLARQLGWQSDTEEVLQARLPPSLACTAITSLIKQHSAIQQAVITTGESLQSRINDLTALTAQVGAMPVSDVPLTLRAALESARNLGDIRSTQLLLRKQVDKAAAMLKTASAHLGNWQHDIAALRALNLPTAEQIAHCLMHQTRIDAEHDKVSQRLADSHTELRVLELDITQFRTAHQPVTREELATVRNVRDSAWQAIKQGPTDFSHAAIDYETKVSAADHLADQRHDRAQQASVLQGKLDAQAGLQLKIAEATSRLALLETDRIQEQDQWTALAAASGLTHMPLLGITGWIATREKALAAHATLTDAQSALDDLSSLVQQATTTLAAALSRPPRTGDIDESLPGLIAEALDLIETASQARIRQEELHKQRQQAESAIISLTAKSAEASAALAQWDAAWSSRIAATGLPHDADIATVEAALTLFAQIQDALRMMHDLRKSRIDTMRSDLDDFDRQAQALTTEVGHELAGQPAPVVALDLAAQLATAKTQDAEARRLSAELAELKTKCDDAAAKIASARAVTQPLLHLAQAADHDALRIAIARSDCARALSVDIATAIALVHAGGDSLTIDALEAELHAADVATIPILLGDIDRQREEMQTRTNALSVEHASAQHALARIAGSDDAARAEAQRQRALARMANAAERYTKVHAAARLLRWAIDRYRQTKQGPMLQSASAIFAALTLGNFQKLTVDFDSDPLVLEAQRADHKMVGIAGLSDGTRDQLYLALRLAALELHLEQTQSLPFLADDLFINFDDARSKAGLAALATLSTRTQVIFLSHHDHLAPTVQAVFGDAVNIVYL